MSKTSKCKFCSIYTRKKLWGSAIYWSAYPHLFMIHLYILQTDKDDLSYTIFKLNKTNIKIYLHYIWNQKVKMYTVLGRKKIILIFYSRFAENNVLSFPWMTMDLIKIVLANFSRFYLSILYLHAFICSR